MLLALAASTALATADLYNAELQKCLFATARAAHGRGESVDQFALTLNGSCHREEDKARGAAISILVGRGQSRTAASSSVDRLLRDGRSAVVRAYARP